MLELRLFGEPAVMDPERGETLRLWRPQLALLAYLALAPDGVATRPVIAGLLWPGRPDQTARRSLRQILFRLRRDVADVVIAERQGLRLDVERLQVDVRTYERLLAEDRPDEALDLYRGEFLAGFCLSDSPEFDHWVDRARSRLEARAVEAHESLVEAAVARAEWRRAVGWAERWSALAPYSESAVRHLLTLYAQAGDRGTAVAVYERFRARLREELELEPAADLEALVARIRRFSVPAIELPPGAPAEAGPAESPFVGRSTEFGRLKARWDRARGGRRQLALVSGEPGIGKTRLVWELLDWARWSGATVLPASAYEVERDVPFAVVADLLRATTDAPGLAAVDGVSLGILGRIVPDLVARLRNGITPWAGDLESGRVRLHEALRALLDKLAHELPVVVLIDDLPWVDDASLAALHYVSRTLSEAPVLFLTTARSEDLAPDSAAGRWIAEVTQEGDPDAERIGLGPLPREAIGQLLTSARATNAGAGGASAADLERETGGNPLFLLEAIRSWSEGRDPSAPTGTIRSIVRERIARLDPPTRRLLNAAAVLGQRFPTPTAAAIAGLEPAEAVDALEDLLGRRLLQQVEYGYDFVHDLVRRTVYHDLGADRRSLLHAHAFERLLPGEGKDPAGLERAGALALHAGRAGLAEAAYRWGLHAAELAERVFAGEEAARFLQEAGKFASTEAERREVHERIGDVRRAQSRFAEATFGYLHALRALDPDASERLRVRIKILDTSLRSGLLKLREAEAAIADLLADAHTAGPARERDALAVTADAYARDDRHPAAEAHAEAAIRAARASPEPEPLARALLLRAQLAMAASAAEQALPLLDEAVRIADEHGLTTAYCDAGIERATTLGRLGRWREALDALRAVRRCAERGGAIGSVAVSCVNLSDFLIRMGAWEDAEAHLDAAEEICERFDFPHLHLDLRVNRALLAWSRREWHEAEEIAAMAAQRARSLGAANLERSARAVLVLTRLAEGRKDAAEPDARRLDEVEEAAYPWSAADHDLVVLARARWSLARGERAEGLRILEQAVAHGADPYLRAVVALERAVGAWVALRDDPKGADRMVARVDSERARRLAAQAESLADRLQAAPLRERARQILGLISSAPFDRGSEPT